MVRFVLKALDMKIPQETLPRIQTGSVPKIQGDRNGFARRGVCDPSRNGFRLGNGTAAVQSLVRSLTRRQKEILQCVAEGKVNKQTASELCISEKTVDHHRQRLMNKLRIRGTAALTRYAITMGII